MARPSQSTTRGATTKSAGIVPSCVSKCPYDEIGTGDVICGKTQSSALIGPSHEKTSYRRPSLTPTSLPTPYGSVRATQSCWGIRVRINASLGTMTSQSTPRTRSDQPGRKPNRPISTESGKRTTRFAADCRVCLPRVGAALDWTGRRLLYGRRSDALF